MRLMFVIACVVCLPRLAAAGVVVGIDFIDQQQYSQIWEGNLAPYELVGASSPFHAALAGLSEEAVMDRVVSAIQEAFRSAEIGLPGQMLDVNIVSGPVDGLTGTVQWIGAAPAGASVSLLGRSGIDCAITRPDLQDGSPYTNEWSVVLANHVAVMSGVAYQTADEVINALAGTSAHEIAHTLGVEDHVPGAAIDGVYSIMASGATDLPNAARLTEREFLSIDGTPQLLLSAVGTTSVMDFNFDHATDALDYAVLMSNLGMSGTGVKTGDANGDGVTDSDDYNMLLTALGPDFHPSDLPEPSTFVLLGMGIIGFLLRRAFLAKQFLFVRFGLFYR